jgi:hypothetical protein
MPDLSHSELMIQYTVAARAAWTQWDRDRGQRRGERVAMGPEIPFSLALERGRAGAISSLNNPIDPLRNWAEKAIRNGYSGGYISQQQFFSQNIPPNVLPILTGLADEISPGAPPEYTESPSPAYLESSVPSQSMGTPSPSVAAAAARTTTVPGIPPSYAEATGTYHRPSQQPQNRQPGPTR